MTHQSDLPATRECVRCGFPSRLVSERLVKSESEHRAPAPPQIARFYQCQDCGYSERAA
jgi:Zn ribbon nucleic-acid-binding protein